MKRLPRFLWALVLASSLGGSGALHAAHDLPQTSNDSRKATFDIPQQNLDSALALYAAQCGVQVLYDSELTAPLQSVAVKGVLPPHEALERMLVGTGLVPRLTGERSITLFSDRGDDGAIMLDTLDVEAHLLRAHDPAYTRYARLVQAAVLAALKDSSAGDSRRRYRATLRLWIDEQGRVQRTELIESTGDRALDQRVPGWLQALIVPEPPPANLPQPVRIRVDMRDLE